MSRRRMLSLVLAAASIGGLGVTGPVGAQIAAPTNGVGTAFELAFWQSISAGSDPALYEAYLEQYPTGTFAVLARAKIAAARRAQPLVTVASAAPPVAPALVPAVAPAFISSPPPPAAATPAAPIVVAAAPAAPEAMKLIPAMVAPFPVQTAPSATAPQPAASVIGNTALLATLAQSQMSGGAAASDGAAALPVRPVLAPVPTLTLPDHFCSAEARNTFHDTVYKPAMTLAAANNTSAVRYLQTLDAQYRAFGTQSDAAGMNTVAAGSKAYQSIASDAFATSNLYVHLFDKIMAIPVQECQRG